MCNETNSCSLLLKNVEEQCSVAIYKDTEFMRLQKKSIELYHTLHETFTTDLLDEYEDIHSQMIGRICILSFKLGYSNFHQ